jgi:hypothetical protein
MRSGLNTRSPASRSGHNRPNFQAAPPERPQLERGSCKEEMSQTPGVFGDEECPRPGQWPKSARVGSCCWGLCLG